MNPSQIEIIQQKYKCRVNFDMLLLMKYIKDMKIELNEDYTNKIVNRELIINGKCVNKCNNNFSKNFRLLYNTGGYCKKCISVQRQNNKIQYNKYSLSNLTQYCNDNNIVLLKDYPILINRNDFIEGNCINNCNNNFNKSYRLLLLYGGICNKCTSNDKNNKISVASDIRNTKILFENSLASHNKSTNFSNKNIDKNGVLYNINHIPLGTHNKYIFNCDICFHEFNLSINNLSIGSWCPYCCIPQKKICGNIGCNSCFEKSAASNERLVSCWSNNNELNPEFIFKMGDTKIDLNCDICFHTFNVVIKSISKGGWCHYCSNPPRKLCNKDINCVECYNKSFASNSKSQYWSIKNELKPREVFKNNINKFWFICDNCYHSFDKSLNSISGGGWCHYCSSYKMCDKDIECNDCFNKSFASFEKSKYWDFNKNKLVPREVFKSNNNKFWFNCINNHSFNSSLSHITHGKWCPYCVNKTEQKLYDLLIIKYPTLKTQFKVEWCKNITYLPFDFAFEEHKIIIELDGRQHFEQVNNWCSPEKTHQNDIYKMKCANDFGFSIIRILQKDVFYDTYEWFNELTNHIYTIISQPQIQNIFMCKNNEYDIFNN